MVIRLHKKARATPEIRREPRPRTCLTRFRPRSTGFLAAPSANGESAIRSKRPPIGPAASLSACGHAQAGRHAGRALDWEDGPTGDNSNRE